MIWAPLLLADPSPCLRWLVLTKLLDRGDDDPEVQELRAPREDDPLVSPLTREQDQDGAWRAGSFATTWSEDPAGMTGFALARLGFLGFGPDFPPVQRGADYLFSRQQQDGSWPLWTGQLDGAALGSEENEGYSMIPLQTALPLWGLAACGFASDPRVERAYEWLLAQRLPDGAWPTGIAAGSYGRVAGYRRLPHSRWGCRTNTTGALLCLTLHPKRRRSEETLRGLDLLLGRETRERHVFGFEVSRLIGAEPARGRLTFFARYDLALVLGLCAQAGLSTEDQRIASLVSFVKDISGPFGLWEYAQQPQTARWVTYDVLSSLRRIEAGTDWLGMEPRTPFRTYPRAG